MSSSRGNQGKESSGKGKERQPQNAGPSAGAAGGSPASAANSDTERPYMITVRGKQKKVILCGALGCGKVISWYNRHHHYASHREPQFKCPSPECPESTFKTHSNWAVHNRRKHGSTLAPIKLLACCDRQFDTQKLLDEHRRKHHPETRETSHPPALPQSRSSSQGTNSSSSSVGGRGNQGKEPSGKGKERQPQNANPSAGAAGGSTASAAHSDKGKPYMKTVEGKGRIPHIKCTAPGCGKVINYHRRHDHYASHKEPQFKCPSPACPPGSVYKSRRNWAVHNKKKHDSTLAPIKLLACCDRQFDTQKLLDEHRRKHHPETRETSHPPALPQSGSLSQGTTNSSSSVDKPCAACVSVCFRTRGDLVEAC